MANAEKTAAVAEIVEAFRGSTAAVLTEYRGLTVKQITDLRRAMGSDTTYTVVKNTLTKLAAREAGVEGIEQHLSGPTAVAFISGDPVEAARGLRDFSRANPVLIIKGGVLDGKALDADEIRRIADLESREVLLAKLAGAMSGSLAKAAGLFAAPLSQVARLAEALRAQREAAGAGSEAPAADAAVAPVAAE
jgi:large subunit ribosomal protein L10